MSYCVNCGVELEQGAKRCPLCAAPVINPYEDGSHERAYPEKVVIPQKVRRRYAAFLISIIMLIPNIICPIVDYFFSSPATDVWWSFYVNLSSAFIWVFFILPFLWKRAEVFMTLLIDTIVTCVGLYLISLQTPPGDWFIRVALPFVLLFAAAVSLLILWLRYKKRTWPNIATAVLLLVVVCSVEMELLISKYLYDTFSVAVSLAIGLSCLSLMMFFVIVSKNKRLRAWLSRKFFV